MVARAGGQGSKCRIGPRARTYRDARSVDAAQIINAHAC